MARVRFDSHGARLVGDLYLPDRVDGPLPTVIVTGAWTTVKEQMPARYAAELAARGFAALAFDFTGWGQSEGSPRLEENPARKTEDIVAAAAFLAAHPAFDAARIHGLGVCASAGYMAGAANASPHLASFALVAPWLHDAGFVEAIYGKDNVAALLASADAAEKRRAETGEETFIPGASLTDASAAMYQAPYYTERNRGQIPEWDNRFNVTSWRPWLTYDAQIIAQAVKKPFAMVESEGAALPTGAHRFFEAVKGPKTELWIENASQFDFYDGTSPVIRAADFVADHFRAVS
jgi:hypothetical protein